MDWKRYIPDHAATTIPVVAILAAIHFFLLSDTPRRVGIERTDTAPMFYQHWHGMSREAADGGRT